MGRCNDYHILSSFKVKLLIAKRQTHNQKEEDCASSFFA
nr:MAG TPA: hypothetical protein [Caudoviricetes sp.]